MQRLLFIVAISFFINTVSMAQKPVLTFQKNNKFRIIQFTDIHHVVDNQFSNEVLTKLSILLDSIQPDLVFFTGDIVISKDMKRGWDEVLYIVIKRQIPWAVVLGNHDDEFGSSRAQIMNYITTKPFCLAENGPKNIQGVGNYFLRIKKSTGNKTAVILYGLDSNAYESGFNYCKYGYFNFNQVKWFQETSRKLTKENSYIPYPALAFFHIPLVEYSMLNDNSKFTRIGQRNEVECYGALNTGMYAAMQQSKSVMGTFVGHDHENDYIGLLNSICLAYGRFSGGKTTYGNLTNGARVIELNDNVKGFKSWIYTTKNEVLDIVEFNGVELKKACKF
jgi:3',5'-cyclic AMP phosphodiesterase CpdA